jgi:A/G-specific adenine glycosylase
MARTSSTLHTLPQIKPADLRKFHTQLAAWYAAHGRHDLPWRTTADPYHIWLSEVMLQQTQVATVRERFYFPFLEKFPTIEALAAAPREAVMKAWEGLGYYRRAGNLHEAAKIISGMSPRRTTGSRLAAQKKDGPRHKDGVTGWDTLDDLLALPGIGRNTAHAILAFAYHQPVAILEANVKRVVARIFALETPSDTELWAGAEMLLNKAAPFDYNQAMMDVGSLICTPKNPRCMQCPAQKICAGIASPEKYPAPKLKKQPPTREVTIHVREDARGRLFLEKRDEALLGGLYGFAQVTGYRLQVTGKKRTQKEAPPLRAETCNLKPLTFLGTVTHIYSHFKLIGTVVHERIASKANSPDWHTRAEILALPLSKLDHKVLALVENCHSTEKKTAKPRTSRKAR